MVSGATYWAKRVSISPEPLQTPIKHPLTVCVVLRAPQETANHPGPLLCSYKHLEMPPGPRSAGQKQDRSCDLLLPEKSRAPVWASVSVPCITVDNSCPQATSLGYEGNEHRSLGLEPVID